MICLKHIELHIFASLISKMKKKIKFVMLLPLNSCLELLGLWSRTIDSLTLEGLSFQWTFRALLLLRHTGLNSTVRDFSASLS